MPVLILLFSVYLSLSSSRGPPPDDDDDDDDDDDRDSDGCVYNLRGEKASMLEMTKALLRRRR